MSDAQVQKTMKTKNVPGGLDPKEKFLLDDNIHGLITHGKSFSMMEILGKSGIGAKSL